MSYHEATQLPIIASLFPNIDSLKKALNTPHIEILELHEAKASRAFRLRVDSKKYLVKILGHEKKADYELQHAFFSVIHLTIMPQLLYSLEKPDGTLIQVFQFLEGRHLYADLTESRRRQLFEGIFVLRSYSQDPALGLLPFRSFRTLLIEYLSSLQKGSLLESIGGRLITHPLIQLPNTHLTHFDLHRANILFTDSKAVLLDPESIITGPEHLQIACVLLSTFFLSEPVTNNKIQSLVGEWPAAVALEELAFFMYCRAWLGAAFFQARIARPSSSQDDHELYALYVRKMDETKRTFQREH